MQEPTRSGVQLLVILERAGLTFPQGLDRDLRRLDRIGLLLEDWYDTPALEPMGFTPDEVLHADDLYLWDALADGRGLLDRGPWERAKEAVLRRWHGGELQRTERGWRILADHPQDRHPSIS